MEGLSNQFFTFTSEQLALFRSITSDFDLIIFIVHREWFGWVNSYYTQCIINPPCIGYPYATSLSLEDFSRLNSVRMLWELPNQTERLLSAFGAKSIVVASFEHDWVGTWSSVMGLSMIDIELPRLNEVLGSEYVGFVLEINRAGVSFGVRSVAMAALQNIAKTNISVLIDDQYISYNPADVKLTMSLIIDLYSRGLISEKMNFDFVNALFQLK